MTEEEKFQYSIPGDMAKYVNENFDRKKKSSEEKEGQVSLEHIIRLIEKSVMLLGEANNKVAYFRRLNILNVSSNSKSDAKGILNTNAPLLSKNSTELFGRQFRKQVLDNTKA